MSQLLKHLTIPVEINTQYPNQGVLKGFNTHGYPQVTIITAEKKSILITAQATCTLSYNDINKKVLITHIDGNVDQPVIIGCVQPPLKASNSLFPQIFDEPNIHIDSGLSSITLKPTGKIEIKGIELDLEAIGNISINGEKVLLNCDKERK